MVGRIRLIILKGFRMTNRKLSMIMTLDMAKTILIDHLCHHLYMCVNPFGTEVQVNLCGKRSS
jgi:hypothetical protein